MLLSTVAFFFGRSVLDFAHLGLRFEQALNPKY